MRCLSRFAYLFALFLVVFALPSIASASLRLASDRPTPQRKGFTLGVALAPGVISYGRSFVPVTRLRHIVGGAVNDHVTLTAEFGIQGIHGHKRVGFFSDIAVMAFLGRGFFLRGAAGVVSHAPAQARDPFRAGFGGAVGLGYEFRILERLGLGFGVDYDVRMRTDRLSSQGLFLGLRLTGYMKGKK